ncbi:MAG: hypothetical protein ACI4GY_08300, partial [Acutalibacteraceae bacterium]
QVKKYYKGKISNVFKANGEVEIFNGKLYYDKKSYDLKTKEVKSFNVEKIYASEKYLTYINKNNNLKRLDCNGKTEMIAKNVYQCYWSNNVPTVIYSIKDKNGDEVFYKRTKDYEPVKIASSNQMLSLISKKTGENFKDGAYEIAKVDISNYNVVFSVLVSKTKTDKPDWNIIAKLSNNTAGTYLRYLSVTQYDDYIKNFSIDG